MNYKKSKRLTKNIFAGSLEATLAQAARLVTEELGTLITEASDFEVLTDKPSSSFDATESSSRNSRRSGESRVTSKDESKGMSAIERAKRALSPRRSGEEMGNDLSVSERSGVKLRPRASSPMPRPISTNSVKFPPPVK